MTILGYLFIALLIGIAGYNIYKLVVQVITYKKFRSNDTKKSDKKEE